MIDRFPKAKIFNTYGPTETTVAISQVEITKKIIEKSDRLPIGYPKEDTGVAIFGNQQQLLPEGETGEIVIYGQSVSKGYLNNPEKTQAAFFLIKVSMLIGPAIWGRLMPKDYCIIVDERIFR